MGGRVRAPTDGISSGGVYVVPEQQQEETQRQGQFYAAGPSGVGCAGGGSTCHGQWTSRLVGGETGSGQQQ